MHPTASWEALSPKPVKTHNQLQVADLHLDRVQQVLRIEQVGDDVQSGAALKKLVKQVIDVTESGGLML